MDLSDVLLFLHILAVMAWLGGGVLASVFASRMKAADPEHRLGFARLMRKASTGLFMPASIIVLLVYIYYTAQIFLLGAELTAAYVQVRLDGARQT